MELKKVTFTPNPLFDCLLMIPIITIPTKQEKFKHLFWRFYWKKNVDQNKQFENIIKAKLIEEKDAKWPFTGLLEVMVNINATEKRIKAVDIDNLLKSIFDSLNGIVYKDDSQIIHVLAAKFPGHKEVPGQNALIIGIRVASDYNDLKLGHPDVGYFSNHVYG